MKTMVIAAAALALVLAAGCNNNAGSNTLGSEPAARSAQNLTPEQLGELGAKIKQHPDDAQKILSERGLTEDSFEQAVRKVAESPEQSQRYAEAYKKAS